MASGRARAGDLGTNQAFGVRAFTLVEIIVVIVVLGILAAIVVPKFTDASNESAVAAAAADLKAFELAIDMYNAQYGSYPPDVGSGAAVPELAPFFKANNPFGKPCPIGGEYDYNGPPTWAVPQIGIRHVGTNVFTNEDALALDEHFDDGNPSTGRVHVIPLKMTFFLVPN